MKKISVLALGLMVAGNFARAEDSELASLVTCAKGIYPNFTALINRPALPFGVDGPIARMFSVPEPLNRENNSGDTNEEMIDVFYLSLMSTDGIQTYRISKTDSHAVVIQYKDTMYYVSMQMEFVGTPTPLIFDMDKKSVTFSGDEYHASGHPFTYDDAGAGKIIYNEVKILNPKPKV